MYIVRYVDCWRSSQAAHHLLALHPLRETLLEIQIKSPSTLTVLQQTAERPNRLDMCFSVQTKDRPTHHEKSHRIIKHIPYAVFARNFHPQLSLCGTTEHINSLLSVGHRDLLLVVVVVNCLDKWFAKVGRRHRGSVYRPKPDFLLMMVICACGFDSFVAANILFSGSNFSRS